jgi:signal transduction histidine kinase
MDTAMLLAVGALALAVGALVLARRERARARAEASSRARVEGELTRALEAERAELGAAELILTSMPDGVLLFGPDGRTRYANLAAQEHLGSRPTSIDAVLPLVLREAARRAAIDREPVATVAETGIPLRFLGGSAIPTTDGSVVLVIRDVTEMHRSDRVRRDFVANASHELKTPAASILAAAETIRTAALEDPSVIPAFAAQLERDAARLSRIVSDLLDLSRLESGSELDETVSLDIIVRDEGERFAAAAAQEGMTLSVRAEPVPWVRGSSRDLALLVRNLLDNAVRYTGSGGRVEVTVGSEGDEVILAVQDTGPGIPARDLSRVFERFYRVDRARSRETGGTGLGLSIVKHVVENHGGRVDIRSELGLGTRFEVRLPAAG